MEIINDWSSNKSTDLYLTDYYALGREHLYKVRMLNFLKTNNPFGRDNLEGHFTASSWIVTKDNTRALITHHKKLGLKLQLGGHCDGDSDILRVALKEAIEESGINNIYFSRNIFDIDIHTIPARGKESEHYHYDIRFLFTVENDAMFVLSPESTKLEWIDKNFSCSKCTDGFQRMFKKWKDLDIDNFVFESLSK